MIPPNIHTPKNQYSEDVLEATTEGALKIPAPTTIPIINTMASISRNVGFGAEIGSGIL